MFEYIRLQFLFVSSALLVLLLSACEPESTYNAANPKEKSSIDSFICAMDVSSLTKVLRNGEIFKDSSGKAVRIFPFLRSQGINTVRFRVWVGNHRDYQADTILKLVNLARKSGLNIWIDLHYSNTWADPGNQEIPIEWSRTDLGTLKTQLRSYTQQMMRLFNPDIMQIGNEIDGGFLWPIGRLSDTGSFYSLIRSAANTVRMENYNTKILIHIANYKTANKFFKNAIKHGIDFDIAGVSYYPKWHGYNTDSLFEALSQISQETNKRAIIAENSYPFTFSWADWTNNVVGWEGDLHPNYAATANGQLQQVHDLVKGVRNLATPLASGYAYWEGVWVASEGPESKEGSPWENQACFDFAFKALPVFKAFRE